MNEFENSLMSKLVPYTAGEQPQDKDYLKLNTNENPYPPSPRIEKFLASYDASDLKLYPDPNCDELKTAIAARNGLSKENVFVGNGSDEVLAFIFGAFFEPQGLPIALSNITYSFYDVYADLYKLNKKIIPLNKNLTLNVDEFLNMKKVGGIIIANPNAPTSLVSPKEDIEEIISSNPKTLVVVDEAYIDFCNESVVSLVNKYNNLIVVQTMSKSYSLAGARCGYALGAIEHILTLEKIKNCFNSYTINRFTQKVCKMAIEDSEYFNTNIQKIIATRKWTAEQLTNMGFIVLPSSSNFLFVLCARVKPAEYLYSVLKARGVLVRHFNKAGIENFLRITIGSQREMETLVNHLKVILATTKKLF